MRNILLAISLTTNVFIGLALWSFCSGHIAKPQQDYLTQMVEATQPVKLAKR